MNRILIFLFVTINILTAKPNYPVLFIHGLGGSASQDKGWNKEAFRDYLLEQNYSFGGTIKNGQPKSPLTVTQGKIYFFLELSDPSGNIKKLAREVDGAVDKILDETNSSKVILCGFSMGGLVARQYLINNYDTAPQKVQRLITLSTPHRGSPIAKVFEVFYDIQDKIDALSTRRLIEKDAAARQKIDDKILHLAFGQSLLDLGSNLVLPGVEVKDIAISQLYPDHHGNFLDWLNKPHPHIEYVSVISRYDMSIIDLVISFAENKLLGYDDNFKKNIKRMLIYCFAYGIYGEDSDLVVGVSSQNMINIENLSFEKDYFSKNVKYLSQTINAQHTKAVENSGILIVRAIENDIRSFD